MTVLDQVRSAGVVGAGGGGFPAHVKLGGKADTVVGNGAECEPLLHKDAAVMEHQAAEVVAGVVVAVEAVGATRGVVAIKAKNAVAVDAMRLAAAGTGVEVVLLGDYYPAGDEFDLVHEVTGRLIPAGGRPWQVGCLVSNVETLVNLARACSGHSVTHKTLTVAGAVAEPVTLTVPVGTSLRECLRAAGGATVFRAQLFVGGLMMGTWTEDVETPVLKTTAGVVVLAEEHRVSRRRRTPPRARAKVGRSACDQCRYCTELCPRYLLGYAIEPHRVMRGLGFSAGGDGGPDPWSAYCCACGLCTLYACPEDLFPKEACDEARVGLTEAGWKPSGVAPARTHPLREGRRVPIRSLMRKLDVLRYDHPAPWRLVTLEVDRVLLPLKQHAGEAARPVVRVGQGVRVGEVVAEVPVGRLGASLHASIDGTVTMVNEREVVLERRG
jgi:Na+-translocating ferredoxin:NAD+ oxidoreductase RnfC subunit